MTDAVLLEMMRYFKDDAKRVNHALKVVGFARSICAGENIDGATKDIILMTAALHDIGIKEAERKHNSTAGNYQEIEGPAIARNILEGLSAPADLVDRVSYIIGNHHSYAKIDGIDFQVIVEADFPVNLFEEEGFMKSLGRIYDKYFKTETAREILRSLYNHH